MAAKKASASKASTASAATPATSRVIVEGEPVAAAMPEQPNIGMREDDSSPQPNVKDVAKLAKEKLAAAAGDAGFSPEQAKDVLAATDAEPLWVPDHEKLSVYANPIAKQTHDNR